MKNLTILLILLVGFLPAFAQKSKKKTKTNIQSATEATSKKQGDSSAAPDLESLIKASGQVIDSSANGNVNWSEQFIEAKGSSVIDTFRFKNKGQARAMATRGAIVVAQRNLLEIVKGVNVSSETTVQDMIATQDNILTKVEGVIKGAQVVGEPQEVYGMIEVTMRVSIYANQGIAPAIYDDVVAMNAGANESGGNLNTTQETASQVSSAANLVEGEPTQPIFNYNGKQIDASMFPVVVDENNKVVFDYSKIYDPKKGEFPKYIKVTKDILEKAGIKKGVELIDVLEAQNGKIKISTDAVKKINWGKIAKTATKIGKFLLMLI